MKCIYGTGWNSCSAPGSDSEPETYLLGLLQNNVIQNNWVCDITALFSVFTLYRGKHQNLKGLLGILLYCVQTEFIVLGPVFKMFLLHAIIAPLSFELNGSRFFLKYFSFHYIQLVIWQIDIAAIHHVLSAFLSWCNQQILSLSSFVDWWCNF